MPSGADPGGRSRSPRRCEPEGTCRGDELRVQHGLCSRELLRTPLSEGPRASRLESATAALTAPWPPLPHPLVMRSEMLSWSILNSPKFGPILVFEPKQINASACVWISRSHHFLVNPGLSSRPQEWWWVSWVSMHKGWHIRRVSTPDPRQ